MARCQLRILLLLAVIYRIHDSPRMNIIDPPGKRFIYLSHILKLSISVKSIKKLFLPYSG